ncbi:homoserine dehydrogenase [Gracilibacillus caseinilyticus]|uniref:Homoserine dehydrogenase n=1 Tax=Gracilibacillus caseinilyticus TaxID=2932256 RepID=A0ABY4EV95_9BACI|nr:homoserine dehydrogenase [Gracilibacillus caseinilyticus]UOQ48148.1 homoserine dehydrogenase [Gracilibacillus caseinilyticus]
MNQVYVGLCGLGTVGTGVVKLLQNHAEEIKYKVGCEIHIEKILVHDIDKKRDVAIQAEWLTDNPDELVNNAEIDIIIEVMGGIEDTNLLLEKAIRNKKHIVTANKDLMAVHGQKLLRLAKENNCDILYDASVAGGIPIIRSLTEGLASDRIQKIMGIVNGTTNYILTKMTDDEVAFEPVLKEAQDLGFAESDPTSDVDGLDAARKMALLANLAFKMEISLEDVEVSGIRTISQEDITFATSLGYTIKLIGIASINDNGKVEVSVEPTLLPKDHPLAMVKNEFNAVYVYGEAVGETMFYGPGAGSMPTATAVVSDLMDVVKNIRLGITGNEYILPQFQKQLKEDDEKYMQYFIRMEVDDEAGTFQKITNVFLDESVSFQKILQLPSEQKKMAEIVMVTHKISKQQLLNSRENLKGLDVVNEIISCYRVDGED